MAIENRGPSRTPYVKMMISSNAGPTKNLSRSYENIMGDCKTNHIGLNEFVVIMARWPLVNQ